MVPYFRGFKAKLLLVKIRLILFEIGINSFPLGGRLGISKNQWIIGKNSSIIRRFLKIAAF